MVKFYTRVPSSLRMGLAAALTLTKGYQKDEDNDDKVHNSRQTSKNSEDEQGTSSSPLEVNPIWLRKTIS